MILDPDKLNADCTCISLDRAALFRKLDADVGEAGFGSRLSDSHPTLMSALPVYLKPDHMTRMAEVIRAIEDVARLPAYQAAALATAPAIARMKPGATGVLMGYDFHLGDDGPKLIEINTNAGGGLLNAVLAKAQKACCLPVNALLAVMSGPENAEAAFFKSFLDDWRNERGSQPLNTIAIVDVAPESQYLYPEFVLFQKLFQSHGLTAVITPPGNLSYVDGTLKLDGLPIDLVYNRLTDFSLELPESKALRDAYLARHVVVTPNPWSHAMFADKRNLVRLTDADLLRGWNVPEATIALLAQGIPKTILVTPAMDQDLWSRRATLFFKPTSGYASKAAYRGDKITKRVWETILAGGYVAQDLVVPSTRSVVVDGERRQLKADIRNYTYNGNVQLTAARLYQGQTTNMRTPGGGFAPVLSAKFWTTPGCCSSGSGVACC